MIKTIAVELRDRVPGAPTIQTVAQGITMAELVHDGYLPARILQTGIGPATVNIPRVRAKIGESIIFQSALVPPYVKKKLSLETALPWLYLLRGFEVTESNQAIA